MSYYINLWSVKPHFLCLMFDKKLSYVKVVKIVNYIFKFHITIIFRTVSPKIEVMWTFPTKGCY